MALLATTIVLPFADHIAFSYRSTDDTARQAALATLAYTPYMPGPANVDTEGFILRTAAGSQASATNALPDGVTTYIYSPAMSALTSELAANGGASFTDVPSYAAYQNGLTRFSCLYAPNFALIYWVWATQGRRTPASIMAAGNVFAPVTALGTATVGVGAGAITFTAGSTILTTSDTTGGVQGYAPAKGILFTATTAINGTLTATATYSGQTAAGVAFTGHTATVVLDNLALNSTATLTPPSGERVSAVTALTGAGAATAGALSLSSVLERVIS